MAGLFLIVFGPTFIGWWIDPSFEGPSGQVLQILMVSSLVFLPVRGVALPILMGLGKPKIPAIVRSCRRPAEPGAERAAGSAVRTRRGRARDGDSERALRDRGAGGRLPRARADAWASYLKYVVPRAALGSAADRWRCCCGSSWVSMSRRFRSGRRRLGDGPALRHHVGLLRLPRRSVRGSEAASEPLACMEQGVRQRPAIADWRTGPSPPRSSTPPARLTVELRRNLDLRPEDAAALDTLIEGRPQAGVFLSKAWLSGFFLEPPSGIEPSVVMLREGSVLRGVVPIAVRRELHPRAGGSARRRCRLRSGRSPGGTRIRGGFVGGLPGVAGGSVRPKGFVLELRDVPGDSPLWGAVHRAGTGRRPRLALAPRQIHALPYLDLDEASSRVADDASSDRTSLFPQQASPPAGASLPIPDRDAAGAGRSHGRVRVARPIPSRALARPPAMDPRWTTLRPSDSTGM